MDGLSFNCNCLFRLLCGDPIQTSAQVPWRHGSPLLRISFFCGNLPLAVRRWEGRPSWVDMLPSGPRRVRHVESGTPTRRAELRNVAHVKSQDPRVKSQYTPACRQRRTNHLMALPRPMTNEEAVKTRDCSGLVDFSALFLSWSVCRIVITCVLVGLFERCRIRAARSKIGPCRVESSGLAESCLSEMDFALLYKRLLLTWLLNIW